MTTAQDIKISLPGLSEDAVHADRVQGREALNEPYSFEVDVISPRALDLQAMIGKSAALTVRILEESLPVKGIVLAAFGLDATRNREFCYRLRIGPRLSLMALSGQNQVYGTDRDMTVIEILEAELNDAVKTGSRTGGARVARRIPFQMLAQGQYPKLDFVLQYRESDLDFLSRLCEKFGIFYRFEHKDEGEEIVLCDRNVHFTRLSGQNLDEELAYRSAEQLASTGDFAIRSFNAQWQVQPSRIELREYNDETPSVDLSISASAPFDGQGVRVFYGENYPDTQVGQMLAKLRTELMAAERLTFVGRSNVPLLRPGVFFRLADHPDSALDTTYVVTEVTHRITEPTPLGFSSADKIAEPYTNEFRCIPMDTPYRPGLKTPRPVVHGVLHALVDGPEDATRAVVDAQGRYRLRLLDDESGLTGGNASHLVRKLEPYGGGDGYGSHSTLLVGTEIMLTFVHGDPDRPIILGAMSNAEKTNPVLDANASVAHRMRTASGIIFEFNDGGF